MRQFDFDKKNCVGCGNCKSVCRHNVIEMSADEEGFAYPVIKKDICTNCGMCEQKCPAKLTPFDNHFAKILYACQNADYETLKSSSSGGLFPLLAQEILSEGGVVCGAAWDNQVVRHIIISKESEIQLLQGSKYVESFLGDVFVKIHEYLKLGRKVLFSGTPCQCSALRVYLGAEYENLLLVDIICYGVASPLIFQKYITEVTSDNQVKISFRNKDYGWNNPFVSIKTQKSNYLISHNFDPYMRGYFNNYFLRPSCQKCLYNKLPNRPGDISLGDFWGIDKVAIDFDIDDGISALLVNSNIGARYLKKIKSKLKILKEFDFHALENPTLFSDNTFPDDRDSFWKEIKSDGKIIETLEKYTKDDRTIAIINYSFSNENFGALMVSYCMEKLIEKIYFKPITVNLYGFSQENPDFISFKKEFLHLSRPVNLFGDWSLLNKDYSIFVFGSDQIWRNWFSDNVMLNFLGGFADSRKKLIAYGASIGLKKLNLSPYLHSAYQFLLGTFSKISFREKNAVTWCRDEFNIFSEWVCDPVLMCDEEMFQPIMEKEKCEYHSPYVGYMIFKNLEFDKKETYTFIEKLAKQLSLDSIVDVANNKINDRYIMRSIPSWLNHIKNCSYMVTDSYHGVILSIVFKKQFICLMHPIFAMDRFRSLIDLFHFGDHFVDSIDEIEFDKLHPIDYDALYLILNNFRKKSLSFLQKAVNSNFSCNSRRFIEKKVPKKYLFFKTIACGDIETRVYFLNILIFKKLFFDSYCYYHLFGIFPMIKTRQINNRREIYLLFPREFKIS